MRSRVEIFKAARVNNGLVRLASQDRLSSNRIRVIRARPRPMAPGLGLLGHRKFLGQDGNDHDVVYAQDNFQDRQGN